MCAGKRGPSGEQPGGPFRSGQRVRTSTAMNAVVYVPRQGKPDQVPMDEVAFARHLTRVCNENSPLGLVGVVPDMRSNGRGGFGEVEEVELSVAAGRLGAGADALRKRIR